MLYAVVDIETTGGHASVGGITEIAVIITDGKKVLEKFQTLLNPYYTIPRYIEVLTGITNSMVEDERDFTGIADELYELLHDKIFVAHNVNFDYSFIKFNLAKCGYDLNCKKLCTIRLGRHILPGLPGYGLDKICRHLKIEIDGRHRAMGDASATVLLLHHLLENDVNDHANKMLHIKSKEQYLPPNISAKEISNIPNRCGVYYFIDKKGKVIYVGKAKNLKKRVNSHFSNNKTDEQKQEFLKRIYHVSFQETGSELMAFILENVEIRKLWPKQNSSQKRFEPTYGLYCFEDAKGYLRLCIEKKKKHLRPISTFNLLSEGYSLLYKMVKEYNLDTELCYLQKPVLNGIVLKDVNRIAPHLYNLKVNECIQNLEKDFSSFAIVDMGLSAEERSCILVENGKFYGMGYISNQDLIRDVADLKSRLTPYPENEYIKKIIDQYVREYPYKKVSLKNEKSLSVGLFDSE